MASSSTFISFSQQAVPEIIAIADCTYCENQTESHCDAQHCQETRQVESKADPETHDCASQSAAYEAHGSFKRVRRSTGHHHSFVVRAPRGPAQGWGSVPSYSRIATQLHTADCRYSSAIVSSQNSYADLQRKKVKTFYIDRAAVLHLDLW